MATIQHVKLQLYEELSAKVRETVEMQFPEAARALHKLEAAHRSLFPPNAPADVDPAGAVSPSHDSDDGLTTGRSEASVRREWDHVMAMSKRRLTVHELTDAAVADNVTEWKRWLLITKAYALACYFPNCALLQLVTCDGEENHSARLCLTGPALCTSCVMRCVCGVAGERSTSSHPSSRTSSCGGATTSSSRGFDWTWCPPSPSPSSAFRRVWRTPNSPTWTVCMVRLGVRVGVDGVRRCIDGDDATATGHTAVVSYMEAGYFTY